MAFKLTLLEVQVVFKQTIQCYLAKMFQLSCVYLKEVLVGLISGNLFSSLCLLRIHILFTLKVVPCRIV